MWQEFLHHSGKASLHVQEARDLNPAWAGYCPLQQQQQQQLSHLFQVFGVGYMNQKRTTPNRAH